MVEHSDTISATVSVSTLGSQQETQRELPWGISKKCGVGGYREKVRWGRVKYSPYC